MLFFVNRKEKKEDKYSQKKPRQLPECLTLTNFSQMLTFVNVHNCAASYFLTWPYTVNKYNIKNIESHLKLFSASFFAFFSI